jgi:hypothetical protein
MLRGSGAPPKRAGDLVELAPPRLMDPSIGYVVGRRRERGAGEAGDGVEGERGAGEAGDDVGGERGTGGYRAFVYGLLLEWAVQSRPRKFPGLPGIRISGLCLQAPAGDALRAKLHHCLPLVEDLTVLLCCRDLTVSYLRNPDYCTQGSC